MLRRRAFWIGGLVLAVVCGACAQSDAGITTKVKAKLEADRSVTSSSTIQVDTRQKVVTLTGTAGSPAEKQHVVQLAKQTEGVKDVVDNLNVNPNAVPPPAPGAGTDTTSPNPSGTPSASEVPGASPTAAPAR
jgi:ribosomal protein L12E/L44/L45/RPP1/RPP2